mmetsp:Transcript_4641/g.9797  ORF Transcript_4641/g.9797 Transcript_4641/m.9797 type:complete len:335 (+) Transcript_4641:501-1505(+)|eukprot:CAMPEP_0171493938 /NCGR_PEP_ID=MMETSP0958-20121227/5237_1 /TAXON_ID=87120 /ORGANISM="Aurantiochytrium limacinum, Strain ATCCMYA-1381" /LENGTH=334 /DNA_ID=CAMNT_0012027611 /DNA_START=80 /DNA_END=1084 /DNA_ORIENTATION=-
MVPDVEEASSKVAQAEGPVSMTSTPRESMEKDSEGEVQSFKNRYISFLKVLRGHTSTSPDDIRPPSFAQQLLSEVLGTGVYIFFGLGVTAAAVTAGSTSGVFQVVLIWSIAVTMGILIAISVSGAHLNPAITFSFVILRPELFPVWKMPFYWVAQTLGAMLGAGVMYLMYGNAITQMESHYGIIRGEPGSELTASLFHGFYPSPTSLIDAELGWSKNTVTQAGAFGIEMFATGWLVFIVFTVMDPRNQLRLGGAAIAYSIGLAVLIIGCVAGPLENMGLNPARDFGPRLVAYSLGWGEISIPGQYSNMWIYLIAPMIGGPIGGALYDFALMRNI